MGRKPKTLENKRIIYSTTLTPKIAKEIDDLHNVSPTSQVLASLIEDGLKLKRKNKYLLDIPDDLYEEIKCICNKHYSVDEQIMYWIELGMNRAEEARRMECNGD